jgi:uncharacterized membrane protein
MVLKKHHFLKGNAFYDNILLRRNFWMKLTTRNVVLGALFIAIVTLMTFINVPLFGPQGGLIHLGYVALFPIAILYGRYLGLIAGGVGMGLFDILSGWSAWAPGTFVIVGLIGYVVGVLTTGNPGLLQIIGAMAIGSFISIIGYFLYNSFVMGFGVESASVSLIGDSLKVFASLVITLFTLPALRRIQQQFTV